MTIERELEEIAARLQGLAQGRTAAMPADDANPNDRLRTARVARMLYDMRRERDYWFDGGLFGEPGWDMLLDLAIQSLSRRKVSVTDLCTAACVPQTTALRWVQIMVDHGLVQRELDPSDARRKFVSLTPAAERALTLHLRQCAAMVEALTKPISVGQFAS